MMKDKSSMAERTRGVGHQNRVGRSAPSQCLLVLVLQSLESMDWLHNSHRQPAARAQSMPASTLGLREGKRISAKMRARH